MGDLNLGRIVISASHRSSGKTTASIGICRALTEKGIRVQPFKKGPDYIDPMWLSAAAGNQCRNLDFFMMGEGRILQSFCEAGKDADLSLIEGNMGFYDGLDLAGKDSTSYLAKTLKSPVILLIDASRMTRGIAPLILGYQQFEPDNLIQGVILNKVAGTRHEEKLKSAIAQYCDVPVLGALPRLDKIEIKDRHLGLIPIKEKPEFLPIIETISDAIKEYVDLDRLIEVAKSAPPLPFLKEEKREAPFSVIRLGKEEKREAPSSVIRLGVAMDSAFTFYYPENLDALCCAEASLIPFSTLTDTCLPQVNGLYLGGGFPEMFMEKLERNEGLREDIRMAINDGMPVYAECGGLIYLTKSISYNGKTCEMVGAIPAETRIFKKPKGHGYVVLEQNGKDHWSHFDKEVRGHEFHYSQITNLGKVDFAYKVVRGEGIDGRHDGLIYKNVLASYTHLHSLGTPDWAENFISFVYENK